MRQTLVSGLRSSYALTLDGQRYTLAPGSVERYFVGEGQHALSTAPALPQELPVLALESSFWTRFARDVVVVNPDGCALFVHVTATYSASGNIPLRERLLGGEVVYTFADLEHPFEELPERVESSSRGQTVRHQLLLYDGPLVDLLVQAAQIGDRAVLERVVERRLEADPTDVDAITTRALLRP